MASRYLIQIIEKSSKDVVQFEPGMSIEHQFEDELVRRVIAKGVGLFRTAAHIELDVQAAIHELLFDMKNQVPRTD